MRLEDIMETNVVTVRPSETVREAALHMQRNDVGALPVVDNGNRVCGIVTDRDIVTRAIADGIDPASATVDRVMTDKVVCAAPDMQAEDAIRIMAEHKVRRLPVTNNQGLVGMVSLSDFSEYPLHDAAADTFRSVTQPGGPGLL